jgi:hypothetical protein
VCVGGGGGSAMVCINAALNSQNRTSLSRANLLDLSAHNKLQTASVLEGVYTLL